MKPTPQPWAAPAPHTAHGGVPQAGATTPGVARKLLPLAALLGDQQSVDIAHNGEVYRLQITKAGKLILTK